MNWSHLLFSFQGRVNRGKYWFVDLMIIVIWIGLFVSNLFIIGTRIDDLSSFAGMAFLFWLAGCVLLIATFWIGTAVGVKRLHDRNKSGWWILIFYYLPSLLSTPQMSATTGSAMLLALASFVVTVWGFVELGCLRGTAGANRYGSDPLGQFSNEPLR